MTYLELTKAMEYSSFSFICFHSWDSRELIACGTVQPVERNTEG